MKNGNVVNNKPTIDNHTIDFLVTDEPTIRVMKITTITEEEMLDIDIGDRVRVRTRKMLVDDVDICTELETSRDLEIDLGQSTIRLGGTYKTLGREYIVRNVGIDNDGLVFVEVNASPSVHGQMLRLYRVLISNVKKRDDIVKKNRRAVKDADPIPRELTEFRNHITTTELSNIVEGDDVVIRSWESLCNEFPQEPDGSIHIPRYGKKQPYIYREDDENFYGTKISALYGTNGKVVAELDNGSWFNFSYKVVAELHVRGIGEKPKEPTHIDIEELNSLSASDKIVIRSWESLEAEYEKLKNGALKMYYDNGENYFNFGKQYKGLCGKTIGIKHIVEETAIAWNGFWFHYSLIEKTIKKNHIKTTPTVTETLTHISEDVMESLVKGDKIEIRSWESMSTEFATTVSGSLITPKDRGEERSQEFLEQYKGLCGSIVEVDGISNNCVISVDGLYFHRKWIRTIIRKSDDEPKKPTFELPISKAKQIKVGDRITIRSWESMSKEYPRLIGTDHLRISRNIKMKTDDIDNCGRTFAIASFITDDNGRSFVTVCGKTFYRQMIAKVQRKGVVKKSACMSASDFNNLVAKDCIQCRSWESMVDEYGIDSDGNIDNMVGQVAEFGGDDKLDCGRVFVVKQATENYFIETECGIEFTRQMLEPRNHQPIGLPITTTPTQSHIDNLKKSLNVLESINKLEIENRKLVIRKSENDVLIRNLKNSEFYVDETTK